tara:strand:- start:1657 stop:3033 length:1377 start_codon:yes stop_codon:yes gene_type:complete
MIKQNNKKIFFIGVGGIGMSGIAEFLHYDGFKVSGSDLNESERTNHLKNLGISISIGHKIENIKNIDLVVYSSAVKMDNIEILEAQKKNIPIIKRAEMLGELIKLKDTSIAISGTHGKTTSCSMLSCILIEARLNPTVIIGGIVNNFGSNTLSGKGDLIVVEADEFDRSFLSLQPSMSIINNLDLEHMDCYSNLDDVKDAFVTFANSTSLNGFIGLCIDDDNIKDIIGRLKRSYKTYGLSEEANFRAIDILFSEFKLSYKLYENKKFLCDINLNVPGYHNILNSLAAITIAKYLNVDIKDIVNGLKKYNGVKRRLEIKNQLENGTILIDDYAHHPTEVEASISAIKKSYKNKVITVFQPHLFSRTRSFYREFAKALAISDFSVIVDIYPSREKPIKNVTSELIYNEMLSLGNKNIIYNQDIEKLPNEIKDIYNDGDIIITMGAGDIYKQNEIIFEAIK